MKKIALFSLIAISLLVGGGVAFSQTANSPIAQTTNASVIGNNYATFNGQVNPNGFPTTFYFEYGQTTSLGQMTPTQSLPASYVNTAASSIMAGLYPGTTYYYRIVATNTYGIEQGSTLSFTTLSINQDGGGSASVTTNSASEVYGTTAILHAYSSTNLNQGLAWFEYGTDPGNLNQKTTPTVIGTSNYYSRNNQNPFFSYQLTGLIPNSAYYFRAALENGGFIAYGQQLSFITGGAPATYTNNQVNNTVQSNYQTTYQVPAYTAPVVKYIYQSPQVIYVNPDGTPYVPQTANSNPGNGATYQAGNNFYAPYYGMPSNIPPSQTSGLSASALGTAQGLATSSVFGSLLFIVLIGLVITGFAKNAF